MKIGILIGLAWTFAVTPATADWIVLTDGVTIETRGEWTVTGRLVRFTSPEGRLRSLPLAEVDLAASQLANQPPTRTDAERRLAGEAVDLPPVDPQPQRDKARIYGQPLDAFIRDPDAPRVDSPPSLIVSESRVEAALGDGKYIHEQRERALCVLGPERLGELEAAFDRGEVDGIEECYGRSDHDPRVATYQVDVCLSSILEKLYHSVIEGFPDPCRRPRPTDYPN